MTDEPDRSLEQLDVLHRDGILSDQEYASAAARLVPSATADGDMDVESHPEGEEFTSATGRTVESAAVDLPEVPLSSTGPPPRRPDSVGEDGPDGVRTVGPRAPKGAFIGSPAFFKAIFVAVGGILVVGLIVFVLLSGGSDPGGSVDVRGTFTYRTQGTDCQDLLQGIPTGSGDGQYPHHLWLSPAPANGYSFLGAYWESSGRTIIEDISADREDLPPNQGRFCTFRLPYTIFGLARGQDYSVEYVIGCSAKGDPSCIQVATGLLRASMFDNGNMDTSFDHTSFSRQLTFSPGVIGEETSSSPASSASVLPSTTLEPTAAPGSPEGAATALFDAWQNGDQLEASLVARPGVVSRLFMEPPDGYRFESGCWIREGTDFFECAFVRSSDAMMIGIEVSRDSAAGYRVTEVLYVELCCPGEGA